MPNILPHDTDAEECVLGSILIDSEAIDKINLSPADFYSSRNTSIYSSMLILKKQGIGLNQITVAQHLASDNKLEVVGGSAYLAHCIIATPT
ncbi:MAG: DnaB-like helicase N-terminal domain-containing protein, partial [Candidatus Omnitrophota bacterium]